MTIITGFKKDVTSRVNETGYTTYNLYVTWSNLTVVDDLFWYITYDDPGHSRFAAPVSSFNKIMINLTQSSGSCCFPLINIPSTASEFYINTAIIPTTKDKKNTTLTVMLKIKGSEMGDLITSFTTSSNSAVNAMMTRDQIFTFAKSTLLLKSPLSTSSIASPRTIINPMVFLQYTPISQNQKPDYGAWFRRGSGFNSNPINPKSYQQKMQVYSLPGLVSGTGNASPNHSITINTGNIIVSTNSIPVFPHPTFPTIANSSPATQLAYSTVSYPIVPHSYTYTLPYPVQKYPSTILSFSGKISGVKLSISGTVSRSLFVIGAILTGSNVLANTTITQINNNGTYNVSGRHSMASFQSITISSPGQNRLNNTGGIGFLFNGTILQPPIDENGYDPLRSRCTDLFGSIPSSTQYCSYWVDPGLDDWIIDKSRIVVGFAFDGYPIVRPFLNSSGQLISSRNLNRNHGLEQTITFTLQGKTLTYDFYYVATLDFPYVMSSYRGKPPYISG
jgi:hypothetical protein